MRKSRRLTSHATGLFLAACIATPLGAQTVRPAVVEYAQRASGRFELVNEGLVPLSVVLEPRSFHVTEAGELFEEPLDTARIKVKLSAMSFRIPPLRSYTVSYEATATALPSWFVITSTLSGARTQSGLNVRIELPHVVYLLQKEALKKSDVAIRSFDIDSSGRHVIVELENTGTSLGRVQSSEAIAPGRAASPAGGFPLFPQSRRRVEIPWESNEPPQKVVIRFANFALEEQRKGGSSQP